MKTTVKDETRGMRGKCEGFFYPGGAVKLIYGMVYSLWFMVAGKEENKRIGQYADIKQILWLSV